MTCSPKVMDREGAFLQALAATSGYMLEGESLALLEAANGVVARFVASATSTS